VKRCEGYIEIKVEQDVSKIFPQLPFKKNRVFLFFKKKQQEQWLWKVLSSHWHLSSPEMRPPRGAQGKG
jgi:hypothetical protein